MNQAFLFSVFIFLQIQNRLALIQPKPMIENAWVDILAYIIAFAIAASLLFFLYKFYYKKDRNNPKDKLGKF